MNELAMRAPTFARLISLVFLLVAGSAAFAHTDLKESSPGDGAVLNQAPEQLHLIFTASVALVRVQITDAAGKQVAIDFKPVPAAATEHNVALPVLLAGQYKVEWAAMGEDGHTVSNSFSFAIDPNSHPNHGHGAGGGHGH